ncbi:MAG: hypothetical protein JWN08_3424 [Frankiales bacterium]|nr:hypothetical protein [Frankiales bacterium]
MTAPARGRARPVAVIGPVNVLAPRNDQRYYRLTWTNPDGTAGRTSGGTTLAAASAKATGLDVQLQQAAGSRSRSPRPTCAYPRAKHRARPSRPAHTHLLVNGLLRLSRTRLLRQPRN